MKCCKKNPEWVDMNKIYSSHKYGDFKIIEYGGSRAVRVEFVRTGYISVVSSQKIRSGKIKDPFYPAILGVACMGLMVNEIIEVSRTKAYSTWFNMLIRCYDERYQTRQPSYIGCTVCEEWLVFSNFYHWYSENYPSDCGKWQLDKDTIVDGNKTYGPDTCRFVTPQENSSKANSKKYLITNPDGDVIEITNMRKFCRDTDLDRDKMSLVASGRRASYKGWTTPILR